MPNFLVTSRLHGCAVSVDRALAAVESALLSLSVLAIAAFNIGNVVGRNLFSYSLTFTEEFKRLLMVVITLVGIGSAASRQRQSRTALSERVRGRPGRLQVAVDSSIPSFGVEIFTAKAIFRKPYLEFIRGTPPFIAILLGATALLIAFPQFALFLRDLAYGY